MKRSIPKVSLLRLRRIRKVLDDEYYHYVHRCARLLRCSFERTKIVLVLLTTITAEFENVWIVVLCSLFFRLFFSTCSEF